MKAPTFEEYTKPIQELKNGKTFVVAEQLALSRRQYQNTRELYNLRKLQRNPNNIVVARRRTNNNKYSEQDWQWARNKTKEQVAEHYKVTLAQAYCILQYLRLKYS